MQIQLSNKLLYNPTINFMIYKLLFVNFTLYSDSLSIKLSVVAFIQHYFILF